MKHPQLLDRDRAYCEIADLIANGELAPGEAVTERGLADVLELGRTPVREAIIQLIRDGALDNHPMRGTCVRLMSLQDLRELFDVRHALESLAIFRAAQNGPTETLLRCGEKLRKAKRPFDVRKAHNAGVNFHLEIVRTAQNTVLLETYKPVELRYRLVAAIARKHDRSWVKRSITDHLEILDAIEAHDPETAQRLMQEHLTRSFQARLEIFSRLDEAPPIFLGPERIA